MENMVNAEQVAAIRLRVQAAFVKLRKIGFVARSNFSCCSTCAVAELSEFAEKRRRDRACYWHRQDEEHFRKAGQLYIRYFYVPPKGIECDIVPITTQIGEQVAAALRKAELELDWNGDPRTSIVITGVAAPSVPEMEGHNAGTE